MELVYLWVDNYKNIKNQGFNFSPRFECEFKAEYDANGKLKDNSKLEINPKKYVSIFPNNINITAIVGENGSGKSSLLEIINYMYQLFSKRDNNDINGYLYDINLKCKNCILIIYDGTSFLNIGNKKVINTNITNIVNISNDVKVHSIYYQNKEEDIYKQILIHLKELNIPEFNFFTPNKIYLDFRGIEDNIYEFKEKLNSFYKEEFEKISKKYKKFFGDENSSKFETVDGCLTEIKTNSLQKEWKFISDDEIKKLEELKIIKSKEQETFSNIIQVDNESIYEVNYEDEIDENLLLALSEFKILDFYDTSKNGFLSDNIMDSWGMNFNSLSSGEKNILKVLLYISQNIQNSHDNLTIFLDEPDNTIHPNWQKALIQNIVNVASKSNQKQINFIITSHSPFILSDLPKENVIFLEKGVQKQPFKENEQTFGANIHTLLSDGFFMSNGLMGEFAKTKIEEIKKFYEIVKFLKNKKYKRFLKILYLFKTKEFKHIQSIIGEPFLQTIIKNYLDELEQIFYNETYIKNKREEFLDQFEPEELEEYLESLKNAKN
jgi:predicted ATPase